MQSSGPFHAGDQILAINDLLTDSLVELQTYLKRLNKNQVRMHVRLRKCFCFFFTFRSLVTESVLNLFGLSCR